MTRDPSGMLVDAVQQTEAGILGAVCVVGMIDYRPRRSIDSIAN